MYNSQSILNLRSKLRRELLAYYFANPKANPHLRELARLLSVDPANLSRELATLEREGLLTSTTQGRQKYFCLNRAYPLFEECRGIVFKTVGLVGYLRDALMQVEGITEAYLYGSFARNQADALSDIDVLIIGEPDAEELESTIGKLERRLHREIKYTLFDPKEFRARRAKNDSFLLDVLRQKKIALFPLDEKA